MTLGLLISLPLALIAVYAAWLVRQLRIRPSWRRRDPRGSATSPPWGLACVTREPVILLVLAMVLLVTLIVGVTFLVR